MSLITRLSETPINGRVVLPVFSGDDMYLVRLVDNYLVLVNTTASKEQPVSLPEDMDLNSLLVYSDSEHNLFVLKYRTIDGDYYVGFLDTNGKLLTTKTSPQEHLFDTADTMSYLNEPYIVAGDGKTYITVTSVLIVSEEKTELNFHCFQLSANIGKDVVGKLKLIERGADWTLFTLPSMDLKQNSDILFVVYKNTLTRLPVEGVGVVNGIGGVEVIKYKKGKQTYASSFLPMDFLEAGIKGDRKKIQTAVKKDNTEVGTFVGIGKWLKHGDRRVSNAIFNTTGLVLSSQDGHHTACTPRTPLDLTIFKGQGATIITHA